MSGEQQVVDKAASVTNDVVSHIFTGTVADPIIAILLLVTGVLGFTVWTLVKRLSEKDKVLIDTIEKSNSNTRLMAEKYMEITNDFHAQQAEQTKVVNESLTGTRILLTEIKGLLLVVTANRN